jgi:hypothetical protein
VTEEAKPVNGRPPSPWTAAGASTLFLGTVGGIGAAAYGADQAAHDDRLKVLEAASAVTVAALGQHEARVDAHALRLEEHFARVRVLEEARVADAREAGAFGERLNHIEELAKANRTRVEAAFLELDTKLQREMALADATIAESLDNLDSRLQGEILSNVTQRLDQIRGLQEQISALERWRVETSMNRWTKDDQRDFEDRLRLILAVAP